MKLQQAEVNTKELIANQSTVDWHEIFITYDLSIQQLYQLCDNVTDYNFWLVLFQNNKFRQIDIQHLIKYQDNLDWDTIWDDTTFRKLTNSELDTLSKNVQAKDFWDHLPEYRNYFQQVNVKYICQHVEDVDLYCVFQNNERNFSYEELKYLSQNVTNTKCLPIINAKLLIKSMSYKELITNKNTIDWDKITLEDLNLSETEKKMLLLNVTELSKKYSTDIQKDFSQIKNMPSKRFYTIGNNDMHGDRQGAFVIVKNANDTAEILIEKNGSHYPMISYIAKKYKYSNDIINKLFEVEDNEAVVGNRLDLDEEEKQELQYAKENLHCCCGYIHVDNNKNNPIAVIDARRIFNFSPQQVAKLLQGKTYDGKPLIAVGINDPGVSEVSFMKVASKKRLISYNYRILYWLNK